jgi:hypothetical protein
LNLRNDGFPIPSIGVGIWDGFQSQIPEHHAERNGRRSVVAVFIVKVDCVERWNGRFQSLKVFVENAVRASSLRIDQRLDILPIAEIRGAHAERDPPDCPLLQKRHIAGEIGVRLRAHVYSVRRQRELAVEVQVARSAYFDAPDNYFREAGALELLDVVGRVNVERSASKDSSEACLTRGRAAQTKGESRGESWG